MGNLEAKERFSFNLLRPEEKVYQITVLYMVFKTIQANSSITVNQLRWLLSTEYFVPANVVDGAVASLTSCNLFDAVSRWQPPKKAGTVHLRVRQTHPHFTSWVEKTLKEYPELQVFDAPIFKAHSNSSQPQVVQNFAAKPAVPTT